MLAVDSTTKNVFRSIEFPPYCKSDDAKILYLIERYKD